MPQLTIARRFCGPPNSANGGYFAGSVAALARWPVSVRLLKPPPLEVPLEIQEGGEGVLEVRYDGELIGNARPGSVSIPQMKAPDYLLAIEASRHYSGFVQHPFPGCFVCGPQRARGDGLRIFAGALPGVAQPDAPGLVAAPWLADESLDAGDGKVAPVFMWAALDCPGWFAAMPDPCSIAFLGELTAHIDRRVHVGERCVVIGWRIGRDGRKHEAGTALFDEDQQICAYARSVWIEPRPQRVS